VNALWAMLERAAGAEYARTRARSERLHGALAARGLRPGERFAVLSWNSSDYLELYFAAARGGYVLCPLNARLAPPEIAAILQDSGARFVLEGAAGLESLCREIPPVADVAYDAPAQLYYTSGTTGKPKGVVLTQRNVEVHARAAIEELGLTQNDTWAHIAPMFHLADAWAIFAITLCGGKHVYLPRFEPRAALDLLVGERVTITNLIPTMLNLMVRHESAPGRDYSGLRAILSGGAPIAPALVREILELFGCQYVQTYGMTETSPYLTLGLLKPHLATLPLEERVRWLAKTGRPFQGIELRVVDEQGRDVPADGTSVGEIRVRGETVTPGYWNQPDVTAAAFDGRWLKTGDLATIDHEGYVDIVDRKKDMILTGGENVYSTEVEHALYAHPAVLEVAVYGLPDELWGERVCAAIVLRPGKIASVEELQAHCREQLAGYKVPREIKFLAELPRTGSGKIQKHALRDKVHG